VRAVPPPDTADGVPGAIAETEQDTVKPYYQHAGQTIYLGDCREILPSLGPVDLVLTDPPYGIGYKPQRSLSKCNKWQSQKPFEAVTNDNLPFEPALLLHFPTLVLWGANHYADKLPPSGGWLVWDKKRGATLSRGFVGSDVELAWSNLFNTARMFDYMWCGLCRDGEIGEHYHPTQKPVNLMAWCISLARSAQTILDPFMGSGTSLVAAKQLGRQAIGIEIEERYCEIAVSRLQQECLFSPPEPTEKPVQMELVQP
jgi:16S rRNA G966 N2-methylase RsmD